MFIQGARVKLLQVLASRFSVINKTSNDAYECIRMTNNNVVNKLKLPLTVQRIRMQLEDSDLNVEAMSAKIYKIDLDRG